MRPKHVLVGATAAATALLVSTPAIAGQTGGPSVETIAGGLSSPLQVKAFAGGALVSQSGPEGGGPGKVTGILDNGDSQDLVQDPGAVSGFDYDGESIAYTSVTGSEEAPVTRLKILEVGPARAFAGTANRGLVPEGENLANLGRFENRVNPDGFQRYGLRGVKNCEGVPPEGRPYNGTTFSNPYAVAAARDGGWFVADAGANSLLHVDDDGDIELVAVLPPQRQVVTAEIAEQMDLPKCTVGKSGKFEPVPTDVEEASSGQLFVTLLPGGVTETNGKLVRINPDTGSVTTVTRKLGGATNLALAPGRIFVNQLFAEGGKISVVDRDTGEKRLYVRQPLPAASDYRAGALYATTDIFGPANLIKVTEQGAPD